MPDGPERAGDLIPHQDLVEEVITEALDGVGNDATTMITVGDEGNSPMAQIYANRDGNLQAGFYAFSDGAVHDAQFDVTLDGAGGAASYMKVGTNVRLGFYGATPAAKPTGVAVTAAGVHAALVTLGLIGA